MKMSNDELAKRVRASGLTYTTSRNETHRCYDIVLSNGILIRWYSVDGDTEFLGREPERSKTKELFTEPLVTKEGVDAAELKSLQMAYANAQAVVEYLKAQIENKGVA